MILATLLLLLPFPQAAKSAAVTAETTAVSADAVNKDAVAPAPAEPAAATALLAMPEPKVKTDAMAAEPVGANPGAFPMLAVKPVVTRPSETPRQRKIWYGLLAAGHAGAAFDAWSTRRAISGGYGTETNPLLRPFAHSNALYGVMQASPALMDFLGKRMMVNQHKWVRRVWWVPQAAGASFSFAAGAHNVGVVH
jgi:hypothetical protein